ncbi:MAG TPA: SDR family NAD(P)-dependent oxidoreductase, partial [Thermoanaerobaculia bacterium]|nr:SDR family NAD(P)-dependent oxidoreductase [Thermoanaerobaculia bacterium]
EGVYTLAPGRREDWDALLAALRSEGRLPERIVHAWNVTTPARDRTPAALLAGLADSRVLAFDSLIYLAQALESGHGAAVRIAVLSNGLQRVAGEVELCPEKALLLGPVAVIPQEIPALPCQSIDLLLPAVGSPEEEGLVEDLLAEVAAAPGRAESVVAWRGGERWVRSFDSARLERDTGPVPRVREGGVYLITGGFGGIGLALAEELAGRARVKLVLLGRSALPEWQTWPQRLAEGGEVAERIRKVQAIEALGAEVLALAADVTDETAVAAAVAIAEEQLGPIRGVIHAAGVPGGGILQLATPAAAERVLAPKVRGTLVLQAALGDRPLDFFVLCSSLNAVVGGFGQSGYCAANAFLDAFAQASHLRRRDLYTVSIGWDRWEEVGMAARSLSPLALWGVRPGGDLVHPLLDACVETTPEREVYASEMTVERHWILSEHRIAGHPTVPGTTYLEMARAAFARRAPGRPVEIRDVVFPSPLVVLEGQRREVLTVLEGAGEACGFRVVSRLDEEPWQEHAQGRIAVAAAGGPERRDLAALRAACSKREMSERTEGPEWGRAGGFLVTGPRWRSLQRIWLGEGESLAALELAERFAGELASYWLHPALLDVAAGAVQLLGDGDYLPLAYDRLVVHAPLPRKSFSHFRLRGEPGEILTCDITILDEEGSVLVEVAGFSMKRVGREAVAQLQSGAAAASLFAIGERRSSGDGILPNQGAQAFRRILRDGAVPHLVVSTRELQAVMDKADAFDRTRLAEAVASLAVPAAHARPEVSTAFTPPTEGLERRISEIWERVLGIERV